MSNGVKLSVLGNGEMITPSLPPVKLPLEDLPSVEQPVSETIKFLSSLEQEIVCAFEDADMDEESELKPAEETSLMLKAMCPISAEKVN